MKYLIITEHKVNKGFFLCHVEPDYLKAQDSIRDFYSMGTTSWGIKGIDLPKQQKITIELLDDVAEMKGDVKHQQIILSKEGMKKVIKNG